MNGIWGVLLMALALAIGMLYGIYILWTKGKLTRYGIPPKPPTTTTQETK